MVVGSSRSTRRGQDFMDKKSMFVRMVSYLDDSALVGEDISHLVDRLKHFRQYELEGAHRLRLVPPSSGRVVPKFVGGVEPRLVTRKLALSRIITEEAEFFGDDSLDMGMGFKPDELVKLLIVRGTSASRSVGLPSLR